MQGLPATLRFEAGTLTLLDQRQLPETEAFLECRHVADVCDAISTLAVRGAPAIGMAAAYALLLDFPTGEPETVIGTLTSRGQQLIDCRPTAVNLAWAVNRMLHCARTAGGDPALLEREARAIQAEDETACARIGEHGRDLISAHPRVLTHCNAGALAVAAHGTALAPIYAAHDSGVPVHVFVDETRPLLQGARLTAFELGRTGVDCTLITDNMAAHLMATGEIELVIVGADRVAANGDVANKIGTLGVAILAHYFSVPFYVACPLSTLDPHTATGADIEIEERDGIEVTSIQGRNVAPPGVRTRNPAFDVTPSELVAGIITERGILSGTSLAQVMAEQLG